MTATNSQQSSESQSAQQEQVNEMTKKVAMELEEQILDGAIELESLGQEVIIRIRESGAFPSGSAFLQPQFKPIIRKLGQIIADVPGVITISGHTDDRQVSNELYSSNWDLAAKRAVSVAEEMRIAEGFDERRMKVVGLANTQPLGPSDDETQRLRNRRVEISILQGEPQYARPISVLQPEAQAAEGQ